MKKSKFSLNIANAFRDRKFKYSGTATLLVISVVLVTLVINVLCSLVPWKIDTTANLLYSISNKTLSVLNRLEDDINIYFIYQAGGEDDYVMELADRYALASEKIHTETIDPVSNPGFAEQFATDKNKSSTIPSSGSVVVENSATGTFVTLTSSSFYRYSYDDDGTLQQTYYEGETAFTSAIAAVISEMKYNIAVLTGHNESSIPSEMKDLLDRMFFEINEVNLKEEKQIPGGTDVLLILSPEWDVDEFEKDIILDYLDAKDTAGSLIYVTGKSGAQTPNFDAIMDHYCVVLSDKIIYEEDSKNYAAGVKYNLMLDYDKNTPATSNVSVEQKLLLGNAKPIYTTPELSRSTTYYYDVTFTSKDAWASDQIKTGTLEYDESAGDEKSKDGFVPILAIEEYSDSVGTNISRVLIINCENFMLANQASLNSYSNDEVFYSALYWCVGDSNAKIELPSKYYITATHSLSTFGVYTYGIILGAVIPLAILGCGLAVYLRRRHL